MINISEIYATIQGETSYVGEPCIIIRLAGCNLECSWCDTPQARETGKEMSVEAIVKTCERIGLKLALVTGGEPLLQKDVPDLLEKLVQSGIKVLLETNGSLPLDCLPREITIIIDIKCPGSGMDKKMNFENLKNLKAEDEVKFIICDREDFDYALNIVKQNRLTEKTKVLFSPEFTHMIPAELADWILETRLPIRLNLQIHKYIWNPGEKGR